MPQNYKILLIGLCAWCAFMMLQVLIVFGGRKLEKNDHRARIGIRFQKTVSWKADWVQIGEVQIRNPGLFHETVLLKKIFACRPGKKNGRRLRLRETAPRSGTIHSQPLLILIYPNKPIILAVQVHLEREGLSRVYIYEGEAKIGFENYCRNLGPDKKPIAVIKISP